MNPKHTWFLTTLAPWLMTFRWWHQCFTKPRLVSTFAERPGAEAATLQMARVIIWGKLRSSSSASDAVWGSSWYQFLLHVTHVSCSLSLLWDYSLHTCTGFWHCPSLSPLALMYRSYLYSMKTTFTITPRIPLPASNQPQHVHNVRNVM